MFHRRSLWSTGTVTDRPPEVVQSGRRELSSASQGEFRRQLEAELGPDYEVATSKHYVVAGTTGHGRSYAALFEEIFIKSMLSTRCVVFEHSSQTHHWSHWCLKIRRHSGQYCEGDQMAWTEGLRGYYSLKSNRVVMYDLPELFRAVRLTPETDPQTRGKHHRRHEPPVGFGSTYDVNIPREAASLGFNTRHPSSTVMVKRRIRSSTKQRIRLALTSAFIRVSVEHPRGSWKAWPPFSNRPASERAAVPSDD